MRISRGHRMLRSRQTDASVSFSRREGQKARRGAKWSERWEGGRELMNGLSSGLRGEDDIRVAGRSGLGGEHVPGSFKKVNTDTCFPRCPAPLLGVFLFLSQAVLEPALFKRTCLCCAPLCTKLQVWRTHEATVLALPKGQGAQEQRRSRKERHGCARVTDRTA